MTAEKPPRPWEQQIGETLKAYTAFQLYRDMGHTRSGAKVAAQRGCTKENIDRWSAKHKWVSRVAAYEEEQDRINRRERRKALASMANRHAQLATGFQDKVLKRLKTIDSGEMSVSECLRMFSLSVKVEGDARKIPVRDILLEPRELEEALEDYDEEALTDYPDEDGDPPTPDAFDDESDEDATEADEDDEDVPADNEDAEDAKGDPLAQAFAHARDATKSDAYAPEPLGDDQAAPAPDAPKAKKPRKGMRVVKGGAGKA